MKKTKLSNHIVLTFISTIILLVFGVLTNILIGRYFTTDDFGEYNILLNLLLFSATISVFGTNSSLIHYCGNKYIEHSKTLKKSLLIAIILSLIISTSIFHFTEEIGLFIGLTHSNSIFIVGLIIPLISINRIIFNYFRCLGEIKIFMLLESSRGIILLTLTLILINISKTVSYAILAFLLTELLLFIFGSIKLTSLEYAKIKKNQNPSFLSFIKFSSHLAVATLLVDLELRFGIFVVSKFDGYENVAILSVAIMIAQLLLIIPSSIEKAIAPLLASYHHENNHNIFEKTVNITIQITSLILSLLFLTLLYFYDDLMAVIFPDKPELISGKLLFMFLGITFVARGTFSSISTVFTCIGQPGIYNITLPLRIIISVSFTFFLWKYLGIVGLTISLAVAALAITYLSFTLLENNSQISINFSNLFIPVILLFIGSLTIFMDPKKELLLISYLSCIIIIMITLYNALKPFKEIYNQVN